MAKLVTMPARTNPDREKKELTPGEVVSAVKTSMATTDLDARIAWSVLEGLKASRLAGPWQPNDRDEDWWDRRTHAGLLVAGVWWDRDGKGNIAGAKGRLGRGHWHFTYAKEEAAFPEEPVPEIGESEAQSFPTVAVAMAWVDNKLQKLGWALVPPFGELP